MARKGAFTLIELMISSTIACLLMTIMLFSLFTMLRAKDTIGREIDSLDSARYTIYRISSDIRNSKGVGPGSTDDKLVLAYDGKDIFYDLANGKVRRSVGASSSYLTEEGRITRLVFSYPSAKLIMIETGFSASGRWVLLTSEAMVRN
jgi:prepilin-type N-terminal cleavage/methylation domain-containing protein